jgi:hypothetical protein
VALADVKSESAPSSFGVLFPQSSDGFGDLDPDVHDHRRECFFGSADAAPSQNLCGPDR